MACDVRGHVGEDDIRLPAEPVHELDHGGILGDIPDEGLDSLNGFDVTEIDSDDLPVRPGALLRHLEPSAGACSQVDDRIAGLEDVEPIVDLDELEGCPRAIVQLLGELVVMLVPPLGYPAVVQIGHASRLDVPRINPCFAGPVKRLRLLDM